MTQLTDGMILTALQSNYYLSNTLTTFYKNSAIALIVLTIILFSIRKLRRFALCTLISFIVFGIIGLVYSNEYSFTKYAIENKSWIVETDTIIKKESEFLNKNYYYYIFLEELGKISVSRNTYYNNYEGDSVYVVILVDKTGKKYVTNEIYSLKNYVYYKK